jgi:transposase
MKDGYHVGIDLHKTVAQICVLDARGELVQERRQRLPDREAGDVLLDWLGQWGQCGRFAVEALGCNRWLVNDLQAAGLDVIVADASKLDLRKHGKKTDKRDAREIARRLWLGDLDRYARTYYPTDEEYGQRRLLRVRRDQLRKRTRVVAQIRCELNAHMLRPPSSVLWTWKSITWLKAVKLSSEHLDFAFQIQVSELETLQRHILALDKRIKERAQADEEMVLWMKILPSMGPQTAVRMRAELGDAHRFRDARSVASYGGLVPRVAQSADTAHHGRLTKRGNAGLRWIMGQWAIRLLHRDPIARAWAAPMLRRMHKNKVRVALTRRLLVGVWVMLTRGEVFSLERCLSRAN